VVTTSNGDNGIYLLDGGAGANSNQHTGLFIKESADGTNNQLSERIDRVGNATSLQIDDADATSSLTSPLIQLLPSHSSSGNLINIYQSTTPFSGDFLHINAGNSGGAFSGNFFNFTTAGIANITGSAGGNLTLSGTLAANGVTGTSTIASGQGFTVGGSQFAVQQGSGNLGIGIANPLSALDIDPAAASAKIRLVPNSGTPFSIEVSGSQLSIHNEANSKELINLNDGSDFIAFNTNTTQRMMINASGQVGIGTTSPGSLLSLNNIANFTTGTSTFYSIGGINLSAGCFSIAGNCLSYSNLAGVISTANGGTGTTTWQTNSIPYFNGSIFTENNASFNFNGTTLTTPILSASQGFGTSTIASGQGFTVGGSQFVVQQGSGRIGVGTTTAQSAFAVSGGASIGADYNTFAPTNGLMFEGNLYVGTTSVGSGLANSKVVLQSNLNPNITIWNSAFGGWGRSITNQSLI
jgi:hypothetical protein